MSKWDDQFDFDDLDAKPTKKGKDNKKLKQEANDFFDLQQDVSPTKLPSISAKKPEIKPISSRPEKKSKNVYDDYEQVFEQVQQVKSPVKNISKKSVEESNFYEELQEVEEPKVKDTPKVGNKKSKEEQEFYESLQDIKPPARESRKVELAPSPKKPPAPLWEAPQEQQPVEDYEQQFDDYGADFQEEVKEDKKSPKKSQTVLNLQAKDKNTKEEATKGEKQSNKINSNQIFANKGQKDLKAQPSIPKQPQKQNKIQTRVTSKKNIPAKAPTYGMSQPPKQIQRSGSRKSLKSNDSRSRMGNSGVTNKYTTHFSINKHILLVEKSFPENEEKLQSMNIDRLTRVNENIRQMIRKFNDQLNQLINKNMIHLREKPLEKSRKTQEQIRVIQEQIKSGSTAIQVIENEHERLKGREGELRQEEYQLIMEKRIEETKEQIKETGKTITKLKYAVNNQGNKLSRKEVERKMAQQLHQIKTMLIQMKKQEEKYENKLEKLDKMQEDLASKNSDADYELSEQIDSAKEKGITLNVKENLLKRYQELKAKVLSNQNHSRALEGLYKSKCDVVIHDKDHIRVTIRNVESQIKNMHHSIEHTQEESIKAIKKAKENPKISAQISESLDKIIKSIQESMQENYFDVRSQGNKSQASERPLKKSMYDNLHKEKPSRNSSSTKEAHVSKSKHEPQSDDINLMKPNFMKKKDKSAGKTQQDKANQLYQRVWNEQEEQAKKKQEQKRFEEQRKREEQKKRAAEEENKKKPFSLKKNRMKNQEKSFQQASPRNKVEQPVSLKLQTPKAEAEFKEEQTMIKPKFTRFNKRGPTVDKDENASEERPVEYSKKVIQEAPKEQITAPKEDDGPIFKPKRFNLRNKIQKKEDSYIPSVQQAEPKKEESKPYIPSIDSKEQDHIKIPERQTKKIEPQVKVEESEEKPRLMLRLRDRQKKQAGDNTDYVPTRMTEVEDKPKKDINTGYSPSTKQNRAQESYAPSFRRAQKDYNANNSQASLVQKQSLNQSVAKEPVNNPYAPKQAANNPYSPPPAQPIVPVNNPYAPKQDAPKKERQGPVRKIKVQNKAPKQNFNIYEQADDITEPLAQPVSIPEPVSQKPSYNPNLAKTDELDLNAMLGIKKQEKTNDLDDLLGEVKVDKKKDRKRNNDFFNDLDL